MEEDDSKAKESATTDEIKTQEEAERLASEEAALRKEVEQFLQEELDKLLAEKEAGEEGKPQRQTSQEAKAGEKSKGPRLTKTEDGVEQPKAEVEEDLLTLLDEPWDLPKDPAGAELGKPWDNLSLLEEPVLGRRPKEKQGGPSGQDKVGKISEKEEEEKKEEEGDQLLLEEETLEGALAAEVQKLMKPTILELIEEEEKRKEEEKQKLRPTRSSLGSIWGQNIQHLQRLKDVVQRRRISMIPFGYFTKLARNLPRNAPAEKEEPPSEDVEPQDQLPRFVKSTSKRISSFRRKSLKKEQLERDQVTKLSKIFSEDLFKSQDTRTSEDNQEEDHLPSSSEDFTQQKEEEMKRSQKEAAQAEKQQCDSFYSYPGVPSSVWRMGQRVSHWQLGHRWEFPDSVFQEKAYKQKFAKHERNSKVAVPLPLQEVMEEEVLEILKATLLDYQKKIGVNHPLTEQMEKHIDKLHLQLQGRGII